MNTLIQVPHCVSSEFSARAIVGNECASVLVSVVLCISRNIPWSHADYTVGLEFLYSAQF